MVAIKRGMGGNSLREFAHARAVEAMAEAVELSGVVNLSNFDKLTAGSMSIAIDTFKDQIRQAAKREPLTAIDEIKVIVDRLNVCKLHISLTR